MLHRSEFRWVLAASIALAIGVSCADSYARLIAPVDEFVARLMAGGHPWQVTAVDVGPGKATLTAELQLHALVYPIPADGRVAHVTGRVQVGEVIETPLVYWTLLLVWPAAIRRVRWQRLVIGVPVYFGVEAITTAAQLMLPMAQATAMLSGDPHPVTPWDHWSRFLEAGGQLVVALCTALVPITLSEWSSSPKSFARAPPATN